MYYFDIDIYYFSNKMEK